MKSHQEFQPEITQAFGTPITTFDLPASHAVNSQLREAILERRRTQPGIDRSNVGGWHSTEDMMSWGGDAARVLATTFGNTAGALTEFPSQSGADPVGWVVRMWANVSEGGASNQLHCHPGAFWSGVYYVDDGGFGDDAGVGGRLILHSPHESIAAMYAPDVHIKLPTGQRLSSTVVVRPRAGRGIIFPSWLMHRVEPYTGTGTRISVALNLGLSLQQRSTKLSAQLR